MTDLAKVNHPNLLNQGKLAHPCPWELGFSTNTGISCILSPLPPLLPSLSTGLSILFSFSFILLLFFFSHFLSFPLPHILINFLLHIFQSLFASHFIHIHFPTCWKMQPAHLGPHASLHTCKLSAVPQQQENGAFRGQCSMSDKQARVPSFLSSLLSFPLFPSPLPWPCPTSLPSCLSCLFCPISSFSCENISIVPCRPILQSDILY